jgi:hypothetical protein
MNQVPKTLDWVTARAECSVERLFRLLTETLDTDVKTMQARAPSGTRFTLNALGGNKVVVAKVRGFGGGFMDGDNVVFETTPLGIVARTGRADTQLFLAKPSLGLDGECHLEIDGQPHELWQVSRKALEALFFGD